MSVPMRVNEEFAKYLDQLANYWKLNNGEVTEVLLKVIKPIMDRKMFTNQKFMGINLSKIPASRELQKAKVRQNIRIL